MPPESRNRSELVDRFVRSLADLRLDEPEVPIVVALSGGCDSVVLLHLLCFSRPSLRHRLTAAHLDHRMRDGSRADADWVAGLCRAWDVPLIRETTTRTLAGEADARAERYSFLRRAATSTGHPNARIVTAHHADDQAETVLFRILRGTGLRGLGGIRPLGHHGTVHPLLPFWKREIRRYARESALRWREDPTNRSLEMARNTIRHQLLPRIERSVAPGVRRNLVRLAELANDAESALDAVVAPLLAGLVRTEGGELVLLRGPFRELHPALSSRVLRESLHRLGSKLDAAGTRSAVQFITNAPSGRELVVSGGVRITTEFDTVRVRLAEETPDDRPLLISSPELVGDAELLIGGRSFRVDWALRRASDAASTIGWETELSLDRLAFPLQLRGWRDGDRIRLDAGSRRIKKLFGDRRVPRADRARTPILVDRDGQVLWIAGVAQIPGISPAPGEDALRLSVRHD